METFHLVFSGEFTILFKWSKNKRVSAIWTWNRTVIFESPKPLCQPLVLCSRNCNFLPSGFGWTSSPPLDPCLLVWYKYMSVQSLDLNYFLERNWVLKFVLHEYHNLHCNTCNQSWSQFLYILTSSTPLRWLILYSARYVK